MKIIDVIGKPCPIPVIEAKKALAEGGDGGVLVKVDNFVAVQNLEKMANGLGYSFSYIEITNASFDVSIGAETSGSPAARAAVHDAAASDAPTGAAATGDVASTGAAATDHAVAHQTYIQAARSGSQRGGLVVTIGRNTMGGGAEELGKILIKGFIYALSELPAAPEAVIFYNSGAFLTTESANTIDDLNKLEAKGATILTCGTCVNFYGLKPPVVGDITDMYAITEKMANAGNVINI